MPGLDQKGPDGQGSMTGGKLGKCAKKGFVREEVAEKNLGKRRGLGRRLRGKSNGQGLGRLEKE